MIGVFISGVTAFPLPQEVSLLADLVGADKARDPSAFQQWILTVRDGLIATQSQYKFIFYGTDWLAFGHLVIAGLFIGPYRDPVKNEFILDWGIFTCLAVIPLALICGPLRGIPFWWQLIDCSFCIGALPLWLCKRRVAILKSQSSTAL